MPAGIGYPGMPNMGMMSLPFRPAPELSQMMPEMRPQAKVPTAQNAVPRPTMQGRLMAMLQNPQLQQLIGQMNQGPQFAPGQVQMPRGPFPQFQMSPLTGAIGGMPGLFGRLE